MVDFYKNYRGGVAVHNVTIDLLNRDPNAYENMQNLQ
jgi:hypothetical protein